MPSLTIQGHALTYTTAGDATNPPLIFVHGWLSHKGVWRTLIPALQERFYCIAVDLLGFGESARPDDASYSIEAQAQRVVALADTLGLAKFGLVGHSMGGQIVKHIAACEAMERVTCLIDIAGVTSGRLSDFVLKVSMPRVGLARRWPFLYDVTNFYLKLLPPVARWEYRTWFYNMNAVSFDSWQVDREMALPRAGYISIDEAGKAIRARDLTPDLPRITAPTLILVARQDAVVPPSEGELAARLIPGAQLLWFEECGHFIMLEKEKETVKAIQTFLNR